MPLSPAPPRAGLDTILVGDSLGMALRLKAGLPEATLDGLRGLVRQMNSYYSNLIEGQGTHPLNIQRALHNDYAKDVATARLQRLAVAHIEAEQELETTIASPDALLSATACQAYKALYARLLAADQYTETKQAIHPGQLRWADVEVGLHIPPTWQAVPRFLEAYDKQYGREWPPGYRLIAAACAHQRLAWVHPFLDGNGRATPANSACPHARLGRPMVGQSRPRP